MLQYVAVCCSALQCALQCVRPTVSVSWLIRMCIVKVVLLHRGGGWEGEGDVTGEKSISGLTHELMSVGSFKIK